MTYTLVSTVKNEGPYLWEWVAYHRMIGFDNVIIFQNDSTDGTHEILTEMARHGFVRYLYNRAPRGKHQVQAYKRATRQPEYEAADWVMALDLDEFLVIHAGDGALDDFFSAVPEFDCAHINWRLFGCGGHTNIPDGLVTENFVMCEFEEWITKSYKPFKSLFRKEHFERPGIHNPVSLERAKTPRRINGSGLREGEFESQNFQSKDPDLRRYAQVNHYVVKDVASFVLKNDKGSAHQANREIDKEYWKGRNKNQVIDLRLRARAANIRAAMDDMNRATNGELFKLTEAAIQYHRAAFAALLKRPDAKSLFEFCSSNMNVKKRALDALVSAP